jgi:hypothetical protein
VVFVALGLAYSFWWGLVVGGPHAHWWVQPGDIWVSFDVGHYIGWGDIGDIYSTQNGFIVPPGIALVLTPVALLAGHFHLTTSYPFATAHPSAWPLLAPVSMAVGTVVLFAADALAEQLGLSAGRRRLLVVAEAVALWQVVVAWGHPEDAVALGLALYGLVAALSGRVGRAGWWFGFGAAFQPLVVLLLPLLLVLLPDRRRRVRAVVQAALPGLVLLAIPLGQSFHATLHALVDQPTYPGLLHPTPWLPLAPVLHSAPLGSGQQLVLVHTPTGARFVEVPVGTAGGNIVAPGLGRLIAAALSVGLAVWAYRRRVSPATVVWLGAVALGCWVVFEPVMAPYYVWPAMAVLLVTAAAAPWPRAIGAVAAVGFASVWSSTHLAPWPYWAPLVAALALALALARPTREASEASGSAGAGVLSEPGSEPAAAPG